jgi:hypothetical protein
MNKYLICESVAFYFITQIITFKICKVNQIQSQDQNFE